MQDAFHILFFVQKAPEGNVDLQSGRHLFL